MCVTFIRAGNAAEACKAEAKNLLRYCSTVLSIRLDGNWFFPRILVSSLTLLWKLIQVLLILNVLSTNIRINPNLTINLLDDKNHQLNQNFTLCSPSTISRNKLSLKWIQNKQKHRTKFKIYLKRLNKVAIIPCSTYMVGVCIILGTFSFIFS